MSLKLGLKSSGYRRSWRLITSPILQLTSLTRTHGNCGGCIHTLVVLQGAFLIHGELEHKSSPTGNAL